MTSSGSGLARTQNTDRVLSQLDGVSGNRPRPHLSRCDRGHWAHREIAGTPQPVFFLPEIARGAEWGCGGLLTRTA